MDYKQDYRHLVKEIWSNSVLFAMFFANEHEKDI